jgi:hypothetical protein
VVDDAAFLDAGVEEEGVECDEESAGFVVFVEAEGVEDGAEAVQQGDVVAVDVFGPFGAGVGVEDVEGCDAAAEGEEGDAVCVGYVLFAEPELEGAFVEFVVDEDDALGGSGRGRGRRRRGL